VKYAENFKCVLFNFKLRTSYCKWEKEAENFHLKIPKCELREKEKTFNQNNSFST
jgi:hypothetical protein